MHQFIKKMIIMCSLLLLSSGGYAEQKQDINDQGKSPKYIFLFIGDGMSFPQISSYEVYKGTLDNKFVGTNKSPTPENPPKAYASSFSRFPVLGAARTYDASKFVTDSASAVTAIASGTKTLDGRIGVDAFGKSVPSIAELLKKQGYKIGIVTSVSIDHATPAGFYAHQESRNSYYQIATDLINSNFDYFGGGGFRQPTGKAKDQPHIYDLAKDKGYQVVTTKDEFAALTSKTGKVIAVDPDIETDSMTLRFSIDSNLVPDSLTLADYTKKGIDVLKDNPQGFFMMIEGGKIDWAAHANDAFTVIRDVAALEQAVDVAISFAQQYPQDTLIIVTGDHETGGMSIGFSGTEYDTFFSLLKNQKISYEIYEMKIAEYRKNKTPFPVVLQEIEQYYGLLLPESVNAAKNPKLVLNDRELKLLRRAYEESMLPYDIRNRDEAYRIAYDYSSKEPLQIMVNHILNNKAGIGWTTTAHSGLPVAVYASGIGSEFFDGFYDNTDIFHKLKTLTNAK